MTTVFHPCGWSTTVWNTHGKQYAARQLVMDRGRTLRLVQITGTYRQVLRQAAKPLPEAVEIAFQLAGPSGLSQLANDLVMAP